MAVCAALGGASACAILGATPPKPSDWPEGDADTWALVGARCGACHSLRRVLDADKAPGPWKRTVERMARKLGSGISRNDAELIGETLAKWAEASGKRP